MEGAQRKIAVKENDSDRKYEKSPQWREVY
jgi:hypothetical protein